MKAREQRMVSYDVQPGATFTRAEVVSATEKDIVVTATADGAIVGGMTYRLDPDIEVPFNDQAPQDKAALCHEKARQLLDCLDLPGDKVKCVRVRQIAIDVEMKGKDECCE